MTTTPAIRHVLYADDDSNDVFFMTRAFEQLGLGGTLHVVSTGRQAQDYLAATIAAGAGDAPAIPDLVLLDVKMPLLTGHEVLGWIRQQHALDALAVVLFTSSTQPSDLAQAAERGADGFFVKPSDARDLRRVIESVLAAVSRRAPGERLRFTENRLAPSTGR